MSRLFNNAAQHYNHSEYWKSIKPGGGGKVPGKLEKALIETFGSVEKVKQDLVQAGTTQFGSGWAWLVGQGRQDRRRQDGQRRKSADLRERCRF